MKSYTIAVLGSHSALDVCRGAKDLGFKTLVICQKGREKSYQRYLVKEGLGCIDEIVLVNKFKEILSPKIQRILNEKNCIFVPHRSFEVYLKDYDAIENSFKVKMFGNRKLLRYEERDQKPNQYDLLREGDIKSPKQFKKPEDIDQLVIVKVQEKKRKFERAFFLAYDILSFRRQSLAKLKVKKITKKALKNAIIEEYILGVQVNFNFFYSPISNRLELIGTDTRRQTTQEGFSKLPIEDEEVVFNSGIKPSYEEAGHIAVTVLESLLEDAFAIGERFVEACKKMKVPVIGPFGLQTMITAGPPKKEIIVFDVSPRMPGSPGIFATPYSGYLYGQNISMGKRVAMEIKEAIEKGELKKILT